MSIRQLGVSLIALLVAGSACSEGPVTPDRLEPTAANTRIISGTQAHGLLTDNPQALANALRSVGNDNEILIHLRAPGESPPGLALFLPYAAKSVVGIVASLNHRSSLRPTRRPASQAREAVHRAVQRLGGQPYLEGEHLPFVAARIPDAALVGVLTALLRNPNVDYIEANQRRPARPTDQIDIDEKHEDHFVELAWTYTRGSGATIGILDSGFTYDVSTSTFHPDGQNFGAYGIVKLGFVDDLGCPSGGGQAQGLCIPWDDNGDTISAYAGTHGTKMAGLVGANDNSIGRQGIAPEALTYSLKVAFNTYPSGRGDCGGQEADFCIEDDDLLAALYWLTSNSLDVASMSFSGYTGPSVDNALHDAYSYGDVLLVSALGNSQEDSPDYFSANSSVMGVGGVKRDGTLLYHVNLPYLEISGTAFGGSLQGECPTVYSYYCTVPSDPSWRYDSYVGGTSAATANVAGIAGLLRAHSPGLTASQARERLRNTSVGQNWIADADWAIRNVYRLWLAPVSGPTSIYSEGWEEWSTYATGGEQGYSYLWEYRAQGASTWTAVGTGTSYSRFVDNGDPDFELRVTVTSVGRTDRRMVGISVNIFGGGCEPPELIC